LNHQQQEVASCIQDLQYQLISSAISEYEEQRTVYDCKITSHISIRRMSNARYMRDDYDQASLIFTALHEMQTRSSNENSVCPSVRLSVKRVHCDKTEERSVQIFIPYERSFSLVV